MRMTERTKPVKRRPLGYGDVVVVRGIDQRRRFYIWGVDRDGIYVLPCDYDFGCRWLRLLPKSEIARIDDNMFFGVGLRS